MTVATGATTEAAGAAAERVDSVQAYFELEARSTARHEFRDGVVVEMPGGTPNHSRIILNFAFALKLVLKGQPYDVFASDQRLWIPDANRYVYPDVMVTRDPLELLEGRSDTVLNPLLVAEVLSTSTGAYDRDEKFRCYRSIASLTELLAIGQDAPFVEHWTRTDGGWLLRDVVGLEAVLALESVPVELPLADLFDKVAFPEA